MGQSAIHSALGRRGTSLRRYLGSYGRIRRESKDGEAKSGNSHGRDQLTSPVLFIDAHITTQKPGAESDYLYELDNISQEILNIILAWQKDHPGEGGGKLIIAENTLELPANPVSLPQLQRIRRQFISLNRQHNLPKNRIRASFVEYLDDDLA